MEEKLWIFFLSYRQMREKTRLLWPPATESWDYLHTTAPMWVPFTYRSPCILSFTYKLYLIQIKRIIQNEYNDYTWTKEQYNFFYFYLFSFFFIIRNVRCNFNIFFFSQKYIQYSFSFIFNNKHRSIVKCLENSI